MASITVEPQTYESVLSVSSNVVEVTTTGTAEVVSVGIQGLTGPNNITTSTTTNIIGILKGNGSVVSAAVAGTDYSTYSSSTFSTDFAAKDTDDLAEGSTNLYSQWTRTIDGSREMIKPSEADDQLVIGPLTDLDALGNVADAKAIFSTSTETTFFANYAAGPNTFINGGGLFTSLRADGNANAPTAVSVGMCLGGWAPLGHDGTGFSTGGDGVVIPGLYAFVTDVATGDIGQRWEILGGIGASSAGVIRLTTQNQIGFYKATPVSQSTGWSAGTYTALKSFDPDTVTFGELARVVGTLVDAFKTYGLLGA